MRVLQSSSLDARARLTLGQHLKELRNRLLYSAIAILAGSIGGWFVAIIVWSALREPVLELARAGHRAASINYSTITSAFDIRIQIALSVGIVATSPIWLFQIFAFLVPALTRRERRFTFIFFFTSVPLFLLGCFAGWYVVPHIVGVLASFVPQGDASFIEASNYLGFVLKLILAVGIAFVLPVFLVLLNFIGMISAHAILHGWRIAILAIFIFCAIATPSADVGSMFLLAAPMILLYIAAAGVSSWHDRLTVRRAARMLEFLEAPSNMEAR